MIFACLVIQNDSSYVGFSFPPTTRIQTDDRGWFATPEADDLTWMTVTQVSRLSLSCPASNCLLLKLFLLLAGENHLRLRLVCCRPSSSVPSFCFWKVNVSSSRVSFQGHIRGRWKNSESACVFASKWCAKRCCTFMPSTTSLRVIVSILISARIRIFLLIFLR